MSGKKCPKCGRTNVEEALYCIYCGAYIKDVKPIIVEDEATIFEQDEITVRKSQEFQESHFVLTKFRDYKVIQQLPATGAEADTFLIEKGGEQFFLKLYRKGMEPKIEVLQKIKELSDKLRDYVVTIYEVGYDEQTERYFEVMEYIKYGNLKDLIKDIQRLPEEEKGRIIGSIIREIAEGINALHKEGIVHRDLKPTNVLVRRIIPLKLVLTDFGISREIGEDLSKIATTSFKGTPAYMAPEELSNYFGKEIDWWHLGVIAYEVLVGKNPFSDINKNVIEYMIVTKGVEIPNNIPDRYQQLLKGLLTRDRQKRWGYEQIKAWLEGEEDIPVYYERPTESTVEEWLKVGFTVESAKLWSQLGLKPQEARKFKEFFNYTEAKIWIENGFYNADDAKKWYDAGFEAYEARVFERFGISLNNAKKLKNLGATAYDIQRRYTPERFNFNEFVELLEAGFVPGRDDIQDWLYEGFNVKEAIRWKRAGFTLPEAISWNLLRFTPEEAYNWKQNGFTPKKARKWAKKVSSPEQALKRIKTREMIINRVLVVPSLYLFRIIVLIFPVFAIAFPIFAVAFRFPKTMTWVSVAFLVLMLIGSLTEGDSAIAAILVVIPALVLLFIHSSYSS